MLSGNTYWERLCGKSMRTGIHVSLSTVRYQTLSQGPVRTIISSLQSLASWKLSSSPSLNKFNRLTEFQPDAPCWLSKGPRWDNIMVYKTQMEHFRCVMGENSNFSHKWQFSMIPPIPHTHWKWGNLTKEWRRHTKEGSSQMLLGSPDFFFFFSKGLKSYMSDEAERHASTKQHRNGLWFTFHAGEVWGDDNERAVRVVSDLSQKACLQL